MMLLLLAATFSLGIFSIACGHSQMTEPQSTSPQTCRLGGEPRFGVQTCAGPCDLRAIREGRANYDSPDNPAAVFRRGQWTRIKYARNNHGPGGFFRLTLVRPEDVMNKEIHKRNAFHFSCWGANPVAAAPSELGSDGKGFTFIGSDGQQHPYKKGYYVSDIRIPTVVPDGKYVLGWVWYGGTGGSITGDVQQEPTPHGYFSDYWSCSYVEIRGGPMKSSYKPLFVNDMWKYSGEGCMSANDRPGVCTYEPCGTTAVYQKPAEFKGGAPKSLTPDLYGSASVPPPGGDPEPSLEERRVQRRACKCVKKGRRCGKAEANRTKVCIGKRDGLAQPSTCKETCCKLCSGSFRMTKAEKSLCSHRKVEAVC